MSASLPRGEVLAIDVSGTVSMGAAVQVSSALSSSHYGKMVSFKKSALRGTNWWVRGSFPQLQRCSSVVGPDQLLRRALNLEKISRALMQRSYRAEH